MQMMSLLQSDNKNSDFLQPMSFSFNGKTLRSEIPVLMGILNLTPDSFYDGGRYSSDEIMMLKVKQMLHEGAEVIDIGAVSTRPGAKLPDVKVELSRLLPATQLIIKEFPDILLSIDTFRAEVAEILLDEGAFMINDISGGELDPKMPSLIGKKNAPYVMMHLHRQPENMQHNPLKINEAKLVIDYLKRQNSILKQKGATQLITDPGFGFGKTIGLNYYLLQNLELLKEIGNPILVGISRKSMINKILHSNPENALNGTTVLNTIALSKGANILRVHDVKQANEARQLWLQFQQPSDESLS